MCYKGISLIRLKLTCDMIGQTWQGKRRLSLLIQTPLSLFLTLEPLPPFASTLQVKNEWYHNARCTCLLSQGHFGRVDPINPYLARQAPHRASPNLATKVPNIRAAAGKLPVRCMTTSTVTHQHAHVVDVQPAQVSLYSDRRDKTCPACT